MTQLSNERLEQYAFDDRMCNVNDEIREMARRLLAVEGQEPVGYYRKGSDGFYFASPTEQRPGTVPLYAAPPAPVAQPVQVPPKKPHTDGLLADGWNACRAAMLQQSSGALQLPQWIPCSERMPETDGNYWGWWSESKRQGTVWFIKSELQAQFQSSEITHWMPLPAAPQGPTK